VVFSDGRQQHRGQTANLSRTGACIHSDYVVAPGTEVALTMGLPGTAEVRMKAVVALTTVDGDQRTFLFHIEITAGDRLVASGRHVRTVVEPTTAGS